MRMPPRWSRSTAVHRAERLDQVRQALADGAAARSTRWRGWRRVYAEVPSEVWPAARAVDPRPAGVPVALSSAGAAREPLDVQEQHGAGLEAQPAARGEVGQRLVDRLAGGADQLGQLLLGQVVVRRAGLVGRPAEPRRSSSSALATRPGTSEKTRSASASLVRRSRRARPPAARAPARAGRRARAAARRGPCRDDLRLGDRGGGGGARAGSNRDSSPNISPGPSTASRFSRPSEAVRPSLTLPSVMTYSLSPGSPSWKSTSPRSRRDLDSSRSGAPRPPHRRGRRTAAPRRTS